jgi:nucleotide-binding universal stress UspA family protein
MIKDLAVHLTGSSEDAVRIAHAGRLADQFGAHVTGLQVHVLPELISTTDPSGSAFLQDLLQQSHAEAQAVSDRLRAALDGISAPHELRRLDVYPTTIGGDIAREVQTMDLFIGTRPYGDPTHAERVEETVLFQSGRGCFFAPPASTPPSAYDTVFVAWKASRESARAVAEAMPFLRQARQVVVGLVDEEGAPEQFGEEPGADIGRHLSRHGINAELRVITGWTYVGEALLNEAERLGANLIVMGGYGHSRLREWALGGATRHLLGHAKVPVLMAH